MTDNSAKREAGIEEAMNFYRLAAERVKLTVCNMLTGSLINKKIMPSTARLKSAIFSLDVPG
jgi:hypothetical protein